MAGMRRENHGQAPACRRHRPEGGAEAPGSRAARRAVAQRREAPLRSEGRPSSSRAASPPQPAVSRPTGTAVRRPPRPAGCRPRNLNHSRRCRLRRPRGSRPPRQPTGVLLGRRGATAERRTRAALIDVQKACTASVTLKQELQSVATWRAPRTQDSWPPVELLVVRNAGFLRKPGDSEQEFLQLVKRVKPGIRT